MTRKKQSFPCYGMQWGTAIYLYPIEESLEEHYSAPPKPSQVNEVRMFGGRWVHERLDVWKPPGLDRTGVCPSRTSI